MIKIAKEQCIGCGACEQACPKNCITMEVDGEGFLYPNIDKDKCIDCHICEQSCPVINSKQDNAKCEPKAFAAYCKDEVIREASSSGGIFTLLSEEILCHGGVVFGAAFDDDGLACHIAVDKPEDLHKLRGSKYLQSRTENTYSEAKAVLESGRPVLYSGTPCQIEGLRAFLKKEYDNLYTQDLICHGCPSPKLWKKYLTYRENCAGAPAQRMFFRHKKNGWKTYSLSLSFDNDKEYVQVLSKDLYMQMFLQNICLRPSCYQCSFKKLNRVSDITLADFWSCDKYAPEMDDNKGCSAVVVYSEKGERLIKQIQPQIISKEITISQVLDGNPSMIKACDKPRRRDAFMNSLDTMEIPELAEKYLIKPSFKTKLGKHIPDGIKKHIKRALRMD